MMGFTLVMLTARVVEALCRCGGVRSVLLARRTSKMPTNSSSSGMPSSSAIARRCASRLSSSSERTRTYIEMLKLAASEKPAGIGLRGG